ncbi:isocitrate/isopropylmalate dehydrogenase [Myxozyma melibiosi]|uniref:Isocitrate/isopropylmalate dehydrogenase n=1 Tax=Myxozyma melibiosi TaxID=54550 RepID=A0ABR1F1V9_9ASCO
MANVYKIGCMPGDGIGAEVIESAVAVLRACETKCGDFKLEFTDLPYGTAYYKQTGAYLPPDGLDTIRKFDAILFGAVGMPDVPDSVSLWGLLLAMRGPLQQYANLRPVKCLKSIVPAVRTAKPEDIDWVLVRENSEGEYAGQGGRSHRGFDWEVATELAIFTRHGARRILRYAFEIAQARPRKLLTVVSKSNAQRYGMVMWDEVALEVSKEFPDVKWDKMLVDAMTVRMVHKPETLDTIVGSNLHMDILSDLAAALAASIGIAPSANIDPTRQSPSMFEPVHGSAFDIMGKGIANPFGAVWSAAMMLDFLGEAKAGKMIMDAMDSCCEIGQTTGDLGGSLNTAQVTEALIKAINGY